jgi:hypothetical protein
MAIYVRFSSAQKVKVWAVNNMHFHGFSVMAIY